MRYLILTSLVAAVAAHAAPPLPPTPECRLKLAETTVHVGSTMKAEVETLSGGYVTGVAINGRAMPYGTPATWIADKEGTFTVEGAINGAAGTNRCVAEYTVVAGADPKPQALLDVLKWRTSDNFFCRVKYFGSADRKSGAMFDLSLPLGAERNRPTNTDSNIPGYAGVARTALVLGESDLRLQLTVDYELLACRDGAIPANEPGPVRTYQHSSIRPLLYRGNALLAPISPVLVKRTADTGMIPPTFNCWGHNIGGYEETWRDNIRLPEEAEYFETTTGNGVLQVKCSQDPATLMAPFPEPPNSQGPVPTR